MEKARHFTEPYPLRQRLPTWSACTPSRSTFAYLKGYISD